MRKQNIAKYAPQAITLCPTNKGQAKECALSIAWRGIPKMPDNVKGTQAPDLCGFQVKSARATLGKGTDLQGIIDRTACQGFVYITEEYDAYTMDKQEFSAFAHTFAIIDRDSHANGGAVKMRLPKETRALLCYLENNADNTDPVRLRAKQNGYDDDGVRATFCASQVVKAGGVICKKYGDTLVSIQFLGGYMITTALNAKMPAGAFRIGALDFYTKYLEADEYLIVVISYGTAYIYTAQYTCADFATAKNLQAQYCGIRGIDDPDPWDMEQFFNLY